MTSFGKTELRLDWKKVHRATSQGQVCTEVRENSQSQLLPLLPLGSCFLSHLQRFLLSVVAPVRIMELLLLPQRSVQDFMAAGLAAPIQREANYSDNKTKSLAADSLSLLCMLGLMNKTWSQPRLRLLGKSWSWPIASWHLVPKAFFSPAGKAVTISTRLILSALENKSLQAPVTHPECLLREKETGVL